MNASNPHPYHPNPYAAPAADVNGPLALPQSDLVLAGRGARLGAYLLDLLVMLGPPSLLGAVGVMTGTVVRRSGTTGARIEAAALVVAAAVLFLSLLVFQCYRIATTGQSLGKKWVGIRIVRLDGSPVNFSSGVLLRGLVPGLIGAIPYAGKVFGLVDALFIFRDDRRCIHDLIASTKVVEADPR